MDDLGGIPVFGNIRITINLYKYIIIQLCKVNLTILTIGKSMLLFHFPAYHRPAGGPASAHEDVAQRHCQGPGQRHPALCGAHGTSNRWAWGGPQLLICWIWWMWLIFHCRFYGCFFDFMAFDGFFYKWGKMGDDPLKTTRFPLRSCISSHYFQPRLNTI